jgi:hypothetical protein
MRSTLPEMAGRSGMVLQCEKSRTEIREMIKACPMFEKCNRPEAMFDRDVLAYQSLENIKPMCRVCMEDRLMKTAILYHFRKQ